MWNWTKLFCFFLTCISYKTGLTSNSNIIKYLFLFIMRPPLIIGIWFMPPCTFHHFFHPPCVFTTVSPCENLDLQYPKIMKPTMPYRSHMEGAKQLLKYCGLVKMLSKLSLRYHLYPWLIPPTCNPASHIYRVITKPRAHMFEWIKSQGYIIS